MGPKFIHIYWCVCVCVCCVTENSSKASVDFQLASGDLLRTLLVVSGRGASAWDGICSAVNTVRAAGIKVSSIIVLTVIDWCCLGSLTLSSSSFSLVIGSECSPCSDRCLDGRGSHGDGHCGEDTWFCRAPEWSRPLGGCSAPLGKWGKYQTKPVLSTYLCIVLSGVTRLSGFSSASLFI